MSGMVEHVTAALERTLNVVNADVVARVAVDAMRAAIKPCDPTKAQIEAGAIAIMNARLAQKGVAPLTNLDLLWPDVSAEVRADAEAVLRQAPYVNMLFEPRPCDHCAEAYQGPALYCSLACALADA